jgi:hypothetical protein
MYRWKYPMFLMTLVAIGMAIGILAGGRVLPDATAAATPSPLVRPLIRPIVSVPAPATSPPPAAPPPPSAAIDVELDATHVEVTPGGEAAHLELAFTSHFERAARVRHALELVRDDGQPVRAPRYSRVLTLPAGGEDRVDVDLPALADGFYVARVTLAADDGDEQATAIRLVYLESRRGTVDVLTAADFHARSRRSLAHR